MGGESGFMCYFHFLCASRNNMIIPMKVKMSVRWKTPYWMQDLVGFLCKKNEKDELKREENEIAKMDLEDIRNEQKNHNNEDEQTYPEDMECESCGGSGGQYNSDVYAVEVCSCVKKD